VPNVNRILETLEKTYGPQQAAGPTDPYEMIVYLNCGYPASDARCAKGFDALKREVGLSPRAARRNRPGAAGGEIAGNRPQSEGRVWRGSQSRTEEMDARGKAANRPGRSRRKKDPPGVSSDRRAKRGENSAVFKVGARGRRAVGVCRGARTAMVWQGRKKLCRRLRRRARYLERRASGDH